MKSVVQIIIVIMMFYFSTYEIQAKELDELESDVINQLELEEMETIVEEILPDSKVTFTELLNCIMENDFQVINDMTYHYITDRFFYELNYNRETLIHILVLIILAAIFTNFSNAFGNEQMANMGFYILYLLIILVSLESFRVVADSVADKVNYLLSFMSALCPIYFMAVALATGPSSAVIFYNLALLYIFLVELLILSIVLPLVNTYIVVQVLNYLTLEEKLSKLTELIQLIVNWILKVMLGGVIGLNIIQGLLAPMMDSVQRSVWLKGTEAIPVLGDALGGTAEVVIGTLQLIKNGIGVVGLVLCIAIILGPVIQMTLLTLLYKFVAAVVEPVSDKRISGCMNGLGNGCQMLLQILISVCLLFLITIAIITATTS